MAKKDDFTLPELAVPDVACGACVIRDKPGKDGGGYIAGGIEMMVLDDKEAFFTNLCPRHRALAQEFLEAVRKRTTRAVKRIDAELREIDGEENK